MSTIKSVEPIVVEEDYGLETPGLSVDIKFSDGEVIDRYCGFCIAHINNNIFMFFDVYSKKVYCKGTYGECKEKFDELKAKIIDTHLSDIVN